MFLLVSFLSLNESTEMFFILFQKLFPFSRKSNFRILHFSISWRHFLISLIKLGSNYNLLITFGQFMSYYKRKKIIKKLCKNYGVKTSSRPFCVYKKISLASIGKWNFWSKLLRFVIAKLSTLIQISVLTS